MSKARTEYTGAKHSTRSTTFTAPHTRIARFACFAVCVSGRRLFAISLLVSVLLAAPRAGAQQATGERNVVGVNPTDANHAVDWRDDVSCDALDGEGSDLRCLQLVPTVAFEAARGRILLERPDSPFGVAVARDGKPRHELRAEVDGLPASRDTFFVAWLVTEFLEPVRSLGVIRNGVTELGEVSLNKFRVLITAEADTSVIEREGPLVLRGSSPSSRLQGHDFAFASPLSAYSARSGAAARDSDARAHDHAGVIGADGWAMPPVRFDIVMPPGEMDLRPDVEPWSFDFDEDVPLARPQSWLRMSDGDTLRLAAQPIRRRFQSRDVMMFGFNGEYPGPLIEVAQGTTVIVNFRNLLPMPTAVHWHGIRLDNRFDGVPGVTQDPVEPGGEFVYEVYFPDAGIYWYHPHHREDVFQELGLYGNLLVRPEGAVGADFDREEVLLLDDILLTGLAESEAGAAVPFGRERANYALMGRFGNLFLVNGEAHHRMEVDQREVIRLYLTNVSNTRTFNLVFEGAEVQVVGSDVGMFEWRVPVESVVIAPAERYVVDIRYTEPGEFAMTNAVQALDHISATYFGAVDTLGTVAVGASTTAEVGVGDSRDLTRRVRNESAARDLDAIRAQADRQVDHRLELTLRATDLPPVTEQLMRADRMYFSPVEWEGTMPMMNWASTSGQVAWILRDPDTGKENMAMDWRFSVGDVVKLRVVNDRDAFHAMQHPLHIHGQRFVVLEQDGRRNENWVWKDTVLLPAGSTTDLLLELSNPGVWMVHCHIAEHLESGMKAIFEVTG